MPKNQSVKHAHCKACNMTTNVIVTRDVKPGTQDELIECPYCGTWEEGTYPYQNFNLKDD